MSPELGAGLIPVKVKVEGSGDGGSEGATRGGGGEFCEVRWTQDCQLSIDLISWHIQGKA